MLEGAIRIRQRAVEQFDRDLESLGIERGAEQGQISSKGAERAHQVNQLEELRQSVTALELALDVAVTSAASSELTRRIQNGESEVARLLVERNRDRGWLAYFEAIQTRLAGTQNRAIAEYIGEYGPLASIIQRRLRSVSGFEEISLLPNEGNIDVRVSRNGEQLRPVDFFSQSQQQILILSLFLTACTTQTWSAFAPILMDDPVAHFDDLNAYSFLDLMSGLLETGSYGRQFIISTCDERLFQLARQRFQFLSDQTKIYRFVTIGQDGPVIEQL